MNINREMGRNKKKKHCRGARFLQYNRPDKETMLVIQG